MDEILELIVLCQIWNIRDETVHDSAEKSYLTSHDYKDVFYLTHESITRPHGKFKEIKIPDKFLFVMLF